MKKDTFYFPHDYNSRGNIGVSALIGDYGATGFGVYWCIIEMLHEEQNHCMPISYLSFKAIAKQMQANAEQVEAIVNSCLNEYGLFVECDGGFTSKRVLRNIEEREKISQKRSESGKKGAIAKQMLSKCQASVKQNQTKEKKVKESKENIQKKDNRFMLFWESYHNITGLPKTDIEAASKYWLKLTEAEQELAINEDKIKAYKQSVSEPKYIKKARTYLADKNFNDEYKPYKREPLFPRMGN